ncbi:MAG: hypothetical protein HN742_12205 [Lentisphaerae bacterium]|jgi:hypothetical protein|nr:hypothetical protein [Lentisphaerota bacterium]MBT4818160.1 hypothetical protein [Lentisphaerota bacterium]MBT5606642.1 hypothetical protein [Lentisphaerota bacterium]MBT7059084.1 hypothetical protein [Lentisphaerota bacterium]MBT7842631.1 hypothetical protein [Lentisphaerota bacterium]
MVIAIDYDGTIADTSHEKVKWIEANLGVSVSPWECSRTECVPIIGLEAYERMGNAVYEQASTLQADEISGALGTLRLLSKRAALHVVTARTEERIPYAREWLANQGALDCFAGIHSSSGSSKAVVCSAIGADVLIDDDIRHLCRIDIGGLTRILLQHGREAEPGCGVGITFCSSWQQVFACVHGVS